MIDIIWYYVPYMNDIIVTNLSKSYGKGKKAYVVKDLSLHVKTGTVFGFIGPNGAGKTSTIKMLVGLSQPTQGEVVIGGGMPTDQNIQARIGFMPESPLFYRYLTAYEFLDLVASLFKLPHKDQRIKEVLQEVDLQVSSTKKIRTFSKGMLQRLGLAQAILNEPDILFLDEPLDGLDPLGRAEVKKIILDLKKRGKTIFINTHILGDVEEICDQVGIIDRGILLRTATPSEISKGYKDLEEAFVSIITSTRRDAITATTL